MAPILRTIFFPHLKSSFKNSFEKQLNFQKFQTKHSEEREWNINHPYHSMWAQINSFSKPNLSGSEEIGFAKILPPIIVDENLIQPLFYNHRWRCNHFQKNQKKKFGNSSTKKNPWLEQIEVHKRPDRNTSFSLKFTRLRGLGIRN